MIGRLRRWAAEVFTLDVRSLAVFRIGLGLLVLADLAMRSAGFDIHYSDGGAQPSHVVRKWVLQLKNPSFHALVSSADGTMLLWAVHAALAVMLILGWRTRIAVVGCWLFTISLQARFITLNSGADHMIGAMLLWACFVPISARLSLDARRRPDRVQRSSEALGPATAAFVVQLLVLYLFNASNKHGAAWRDGSAVMIALHVDQLTTGLGIWVRDNLPWLSKPLTWGTLVIEFSSVLLLVPSRRLRMPLLAVFWSFHIGLWAFMRIALFSPSCMVAWLALVPGSTWDSGPLCRLGACMLPGLGVPWRPRAVSSVTVAALLILPIWTNFYWAMKVPRPAFIKRAANMTRLNQGWKMFAPKPWSKDIWYIVEATRGDGKREHLLRDPGESRMTWDMPRSGGPMYRTAKHRWLWMSLKCDKTKARCRRLLKHVCRTHNVGRPKNSPDRAMSLTFWRLKERTKLGPDHRPRRRAKVKKERVWKGRCPADP